MTTECSKTHSCCLTEMIWETIKYDFVSYWNFMLYIIFKSIYYYFSEFSESLPNSHFTIKLNVQLQTYTVPSKPLATPSARYHGCTTSLDPGNLSI